MWNWLRNSKNLAVLTAVATVIGFVWTKLTPAKEVSAPSPTPAPPPININIDAKQTNTQAVSPPTAAVPVPVTVPAPDSAASRKTLPVAHQQGFPVRRKLATGVPNEILPGFWLTLEGYEGTPNNMTVHLASPSWGNRDLSFKVGSPSFDFSHGGNTYQLSIESMEEGRVHISIHR